LYLVKHLGLDADMTARLSNVLAVNELFQFIAARIYEDTDMAAITDYMQRGDMNRDGVFDNYDMDYFDRQLGSEGDVHWAGEANLFGFTGRERDQETGLQYNRARYYDARAGRWISEDPIGFAAGDANLSRYVGNGTTNYADPTGRDRRRVVWFSHVWIELRDPNGNVTQLHFGPDGYYTWQPEDSMFAFPIEQWQESTPRQDQRLRDLWRDLHTDLRAGRGNDWLSPFPFNLLWNC